jgi:hypothetical protein
MTALLLLVLAVLGCDRVHDLSVPSVPIVTFHGHVDTTMLTRTAPDAPLIGALVWAAVAAVNPVCLPLPPPPELAADCSDPYGVFIGEIEAGVPVDASGNFDVTLLTLPQVSLSVGDQSTRIAYGSLIVVEDIDGDGQPSFPPTTLGGEGDRLAAPTATTTSDRVVAASFWSLEAPQQRIVFREGGFVTPSSFYPACGWTSADDPNVPPPGFSVLTVPAYDISQPLPPPEGCAVQAPDVPVELTPITVADGLGLICRPVQLADATFRRMRNDTVLAPSGVPPWCSADGTVMAERFEGGRLCPSLRSYTLHCALDPGCATPGSEVIETPPPWWPCSP